MSGHGYNDDLAYGSYNQGQGQGEGQEGERGILSDISNSFRRPHGQGQQQPQNVTSLYQPQLYGQQQQPGSQGQPQYGRPTSSSNRPSSGQQSSGGGLFSFDKLSSTIHQIGSDVKTKLSGPGELHSHTHESGVCAQGAHDGHQLNRFFSFAPERPQGNAVKWYVDACGYMWAVSVALEQARESIWILDWWLSPELYLRRPPAKNEEYRVDRMLKAAAERGVKVNIIVYKEVTQALTLSSYHTKHTLESLHPNIAVFRHPDHLPDAQVVNSSFLSSLQNVRLNAATAGQLPGDALKAIYGVANDTVLYWAHHEKLCIVDGRTAFMGGIDLCYGRWDTNQHSIADCHPGDISRVVFPGQDYNNARIMDFQDVQNWQNNKLDRTKYPRMGWTDLSISLQGAAVDDLREHFIQRWNFIYGEKYGAKNEDKRYQPLSYLHPQGIVASSYPQIKQVGGQPGQQTTAPATSTGYGHQQQSFAPPPGSSNPTQGSQATQYFPPPPGQSGTGQQTAAGSTLIGPGGQPYSAQGSTAGTTSPLPTQTGFPPTMAEQQQYGQQQSYQGGSFPPPPPGAPTSSDPYGQRPAAQSHQPASNQPYSGPGSTYFPPPPTQAATSQGTGTRGFDEPEYGESTRGFDPSDDGPAEGERGFLSSGGKKSSGRPTSSSGKSGGFRDQFMQRAQQGLQQIDSRYGSQITGGLQKLDSRFGTHTGKYANQYLGQHGPQGPQSTQAYQQSVGQRSGMSCQIVRSCAKWSHGVAVEHSIANAYIEIIKRSQHFIYIENQFFITAVDDKQRPIKNKIGAAIAERIIRAGRNGQKFKVIVCMPAIPAFAGDLKADDALSTRAIMEFQYKSISRGGYSIYQTIAKAGFNPLDYIRFYNLRNYDRINASAAMAEAEKQSGVSYQQAQTQYDQKYAPNQQYAQGPGGFVAPETGYGGVAGVQTAARGLDDMASGTRGLGDDESTRDPYQAYKPPQQQGQQPPPPQPGAGGYSAYHPPGSQQPQQQSQSSAYGSTPQQPYTPTSATTSGSHGAGYGSSQSYGGYEAQTQSTTSTPAPQSAASGYQQSPPYGQDTAASQQHGYGATSPPPAQQQYSASSTPAPASTGGYQQSAPVEAPGYIPGYGDTQSPPQSTQPQSQQPYGQPQHSAAGVPDTSYGQQQHQATGYGANIPPPPPVQPLPGQPQTQQQIPQQQYGTGYQTASQDQYHQYQTGAAQLGNMSGLGSSGKYDTVATSYMEGGEDISKVPWEQGAGQSEIDAFVSEELYIHSKVMIADDRICILGSANLNDRSQLGDHDSEIAIVIEDSDLIDSVMDQRPYKAGRFPSSLRRTLFRKHLGLLKPQNYEAVEEPGFYPVSSGYGPAGIGASENEYDWGSPEDIQVQDPLDPRFENVWNGIAHTNTEVFARIFHPVPYDGVRTWAQYEDWYEKYFRNADNNKDVKDGKKPPGKYLQCHVVSEMFPGGVQEVKGELAKVRGTIVEMPLVFLKDEDVAKEGLGLNAFTEEVYT